MTTIEFLPEAREDLALFYNINAPKLGQEAGL